MTSVKADNISSPRNYMVDLLRVIAMILVITHHYLGHGGVLENAALFSFNWYISWFVKTTCYTSVTCFYLISAFYQSDKPQGIRGIVSIWITVEFYSILCFLISCGTGLATFSPLGLMKALLPLTFRQYGFVNGYILLSLLIPFANTAVKALDKRTHKRLVTLLAILCSVLPYISFIDPFNLDYGEGVLWIILLYLIAYYIRFYYEPKKNLWTYLIVFVSAATLTFMTKVIISYITQIVLGEAKFSGAFIGETQLLMLISSVSLFSFFLFWGNCHDSKLVRIGSRLSKYVFAVFLIHENNNIKFHLWNILNPGQYANSSLFVLIGYWLLIVFSLFILAILFEMIRKVIVNSIHIDKKAINLVNRIQRKIRI